MDARILKVLYVDSSPMLSERVGMMLKEMENVLFCGTAATVDSAMNLINLIKPDVVIVDAQTSTSESSSNEFAFIDSVRENHPSVVVMMLTSKTDSRYRNRYLERGAHYFFDKALEFEKIQMILSGLSGRKEI